MPHEHSKRFNPAELAKLEDPDRAKFFPVDRILDLAGIRKGQVVADVGAGTGFFAIPIAQRVAPGEVRAVDVSPDMLSYLASKLEQPAMPRNIQLIAGEDSQTNLAEASCDIVFTSAMWHEIDDHVAALAEFARILKPAGLLAIVDWNPATERISGPPLDHRISRGQVEVTLTEAHWTVVHSESINPSIYVVIAARA